MNELWTWVRFAWHNCLRNLRRSLVTTAIAMLGTAAILLAGGFALFTYDSLAQASARDTGHLVLTLTSTRWSLECRILLHTNLLIICNIARKLI